MSMYANPFEALGLPARRDLTDEQVREAWRKVAAATHPDRPDGGDLARYTAASAAFAELRTPWSRSEAWADLAEQAWAQGRDAPGGEEVDHGEPDTSPLPAIPAARPPGSPPGTGPAHPLVAAAVPDPPRPPRPPAPPRRHRRRLVPAGAEPDLGPARRPRRYHRPDPVVRAHRPQGPGTPARTLTAKNKNASGGASGSEMDPARAKASPPYPAGEEKQGHPVPAGQGKPSTPPAARPGRSSGGALHLDRRRAARTPAGGRR